jgi:SAM-dependent methyltransferase
VAMRIRRMLPRDFDFTGKRVLDFGCGSARVLRHFLDEADRAELWGCDVDDASIRWIESHLSPPLRPIRNGLGPPLPFDDGSLDLVWAASVFTHIQGWSEWLAEIHRVLAPDGLFLASYLGESMWEPLVNEPYREDEVGMTVLHHWRGPDADVLHSEWWLRQHWGRAFDFLAVERPGRNTDGTPTVAHSWLTLSKRQVTITPAELEARDPGERRELAALETNIRVLRYEIAALLQVGRSRSRARSTVRALARRLRSAARARSR